MALNLPSPAAQYFIDEVLLPAWQPSEARGFAVQGVAPGDEAFLPVARTIDSVGAVYPSLILQRSNETSGGESTYSFMTSDGPGQNRTGTLLATARAQDNEDDYTGDSSTYDAVDANQIVVELVDEVEAVCQRRADAPNSEFETIGSQRGPDVPDDTDEDPPVRIAQCEIRYSWTRDP
jgi:hypothetical protein